MNRKIHVFAVRYREDISPFIDNFYTDKSISFSHTKLTIINNYGILEEPPNLSYKVLNNTLRPDFSTGHLSRNWNQAIINGFKDLNNPIVDLVICIQIDAILGPNWYFKLNKLLDSYPKLEYIALGDGDEFQVFTPNIIKSIGLYDERYCNIGYQEADYFRRVWIKKSLNSLIFDSFHGRTLNKLNIPPYEFSNIIIRDPKKTINEYHIKSKVHHNVSKAVFHYKWGTNANPEFWDQSKIPIVNSSDKKEFKYYPYFEKDIDKKIYVLDV